MLGFFGLGFLVLSLGLGVQGSIFFWGGDLVFVGVER